MFKRWMRIISLILVAVLLFNMLPAQAMATRSIPNAENILPLEVNETEEVQILGEVIENRTEFSKEYVLSNGLHMAQIYAYSVHYQTENGWEEIDNTLTAQADNTYQNTQGLLQVSFPQNLENNAPVSITKDGYTLSFSMAGEVNSYSLFRIGTYNIGEISVVSDAAGSAAEIEEVDLSSLKETAQYAETVPDKLYSRLIYEEVYHDTDVIYDLQSNQVKESVVLEQYDSNLRGYRYALNTGLLIPVLGEDGHIDFYDENGENIVLVMPAPFLTDAANVCSYDVGVTLEGEAGEYTLNYTLPQQWLSAEDRVWPVVLDPVIQPSMNINNIRDCNVSTNWEYSQTSGTLDVGLFADVGIARSFVKYANLPSLTSADVVVKAQIRLYKATNIGPAEAVEVHEVLGDWDSTTVTWANMPDHNPIVEDYVIALNEGYYYWDVTDIARKWYATGNNYGMLFRCPDSVENGGAVNYREFWSSDFGVTSLMPTLYIYFRNTNGLESYWDYSAASAGQAGTGYVNNYTGNLMWERTHMGFGGSRMPVSISHIYSANDSARITNDGNNANDSGGNYFGLGNGWRTNFHQRIFRWDVNSNYYCWEDEDGTDHYFIWQDDAYKDEDGLELTLTINNSSSAERYVIEDKYGNKRIFDQYGRLRELRNNQQTTSSITVSYTTSSGNQISAVTDGAGRVYAYSYENGLLSRISYMGTGDKEYAWVGFTYTGDNLTGIIDHTGKESTYAYDGNILIGAADPAGYRLAYTYHAKNSDFQPYRVAAAIEYDGDTKGSSLSFLYGNNQTVLTDSLKNKQILQFNNFGNVVSVQDGEGHAQYAQYAKNTDEQAGKGNQLLLSSKMQNTVGNMLINHGFDMGSAWEYVGVEGIPFLTDEETYLGKFSLQIIGGSTARQYPVTVEAGKTYTFSAYVKTTESSAKLGLLTDSGWVYSQELPAYSDWTRLQVSYTVQSETHIVPAITTQGGTYSYMDCVQMECAPTASRYNLVENGDFRFASDSAYGWTATGFSDTDGLTTQTPDAPQLDDNVIAITGDFYTQKHLSQTLSISGSAGDSFILSGWAKGDSVPLRNENNNERQFGLKLTFHYSDGTESSETVNFNPDTDNAGNWQYASAPAAAKKYYTSVTVTILYDYNCNTAYFDGIQLYKETFGTSYTYDDDGNVISTVDLQKKQTTYEYDKNSNLTAILEDNKAKMTYTYDSWHNVTSATTEKGQTYTFAYDTYGNNTQVGIVGDGKTISAAATYTPDGHRMLSSTDANGNITRYDYDPNTGLLQWVQYPEDTEATRTEYTYDEMFRMASAAATTDTGLALNAAYHYDAEGLLDAIQTPSTTYIFAYGAFDLRESVKVGDRTLAEYSYDEYHRLTELDYGNGDKVKYDYDNLSRVTRETYENGDYIDYSYDNDGNLAGVYDSATGITTTYYYDLLGRALYYTKQGANDQTVYYTYDAENNLESLTETVNGDTQSYRYTYDEDNRLTSVTVNGIAVTYTYDDFSRLTQKVTKQGDTVIKTESYTFAERTENGITYTSAQVASYRVVTEKTDITYCYTYDNNGNILSISDGTNTTSYVYDSVNQLIRENNQESNYTHAWEYDDAGNILNRKEYAYTTGELADLTPVRTVRYAYEDNGGTAPVVGENEFEILIYDEEQWSGFGPGQGENEFDILPFGEEETPAAPVTEDEPEEEPEPEVWGDLLTSYDGRRIVYDGIGNPLDDGKWKYTWQHGRQLVSMESGNVTWNYTYGADGLRTSRTNGTKTYTYTYNGSQLVQMTVNGDTLRFAYDATGTPLAVTYNSLAYYYVTNIQGDVVAVVDADGTELVRYTYDAWGKLLSTTGTMAAILGANNPLRYRGYVYDTETGLYYLQSRYYDPIVGRFINGDNYPCTGQGFSGNNMFAYCGNNPVMRSDVAGNWWDIFWDIVSLGASIVEVCVNPTDPWAWAGLAGDAADVFLPCVSGIGETTRAVKATVTVVDNVDEVVDAAKTLYKAADKANDIRHSTGIYEIIYESGKNYIGKGGFDRAISSALRNANKYGDKVNSIVWASVPDSRTAFVYEYLLQKEFGGVLSSNKDLLTYNKIWSPGKRYFGD